MEVSEMFLRLRKALVSQISDFTVQNVHDKRGSLYIQESSSLPRSPGIPPKRGLEQYADHAACSSDDTITEDCPAVHSDDEDEVEAIQSRVGDGMQDMRARLVRTVFRGEQSRYALKVIKGELDEKTTLHAAQDLASEASFLQSITHSNIISLRATVGEPGTLSFGLVLDRLTMTLPQRIKAWRKEQLDVRGSTLTRTFKTIFLRKEQKEYEQVLFEDRLLVTLDIARAISHLHDNGILYRDLKPDNVGFNVRGDVQIFDFGLAKELKATDLVEVPDGYEVTGLTGSLRYMAPEVRCFLPYGFSADVYSFALLLWQIFALKTPFPSWDANQLFRKVVEGKKRPHRLSNLPACLHRMMEKGWSDDRHQRPTFKEISLQLQKVYNIIQNTNASNVMDRSKQHSMDLSSRWSLTDEVHQLTRTAPKPPPNSAPIPSTIAQRIPTPFVDTTPAA
jgi:serine/threonine protein kinase